MSYITVGVRVRPMIQRELQEGQNNCLNVTDKTITARESLNSNYDDALIFPSYNFNFDQVYGPTSTQEQVCEITNDTINSFVEGINGCILTYGQTSSGKSYTIQNDNSGIIPHALTSIFDQLVGKDYEMQVSFLQIYNEQILDLLDGQNQKLTIREQQGQIFVENLTTYQVNSPEEALSLVAVGNEARKTSETAMNMASSRSHAVYCIYLSQTTETSQIFSKLSILDLAGSERAHSVQKDVLRETKHINTSLAVLSNVLNALLLKNKNPKQFVPYRDSKLTRLLSDSLGKNCKSVILTTISPGNFNFSETINSLRFADRAKAIRQNGVVNVIESENQKIERYKVEIEALRRQIGLVRGQQSSVEDIMCQSDQTCQINVKNTKNGQIIPQDDPISPQQTEEENQNLLNLRTISLQQKDIMISLTQKLQESEDEYQETITQIEQIQERIESYVQQIQQVKSGLEQQKIIIGDKFDAEFVSKNHLKNFIESEEQPNSLINCYFTDQQTDFDESLSIEQKYEELQHIKSNYGQKIVDLQKKLQQLKQASIVKQQKLETLTDQIISDLNISKTDRFCEQKLTECQQERKLMLKIFNEKVMLKLDKMSAGEAVNLNNYLMKVCDALENGQLYQSLSSMFK